MQSNNIFKEDKKTIPMENPVIKERHFRIGKIEYHLRLIPQKCRDSDKGGFSQLTKLLAFLSGTFHFTHTNGVVECRETYEGFLLKNRKPGTFEEIWESGVEEEYHDLGIYLGKDSPPKRIRITEVFSDCYGVQTLKRQAQKKTGISGGWKKIENFSGLE